MSQFEFPTDNNQDQKLLIGEASPSYLPSKEVPKLIYESCPNVKIIISLRNPTDRAISHYYHQVNRVKDETRPIELAFSSQEIADLEKKPYSKTSSYIQLGKYFTQVKNWLNVFPKEQVLVLNYHTLETNPDNFIKKIFAFLELPNYLIADVKKIYDNQYPAIPLEIKQRLDEYFKPYNQEISDFLDIQLDSN